jgi:hypothetical protein
MAPYPLQSLREPGTGKYQVILYLDMILILYVSDKKMEDIRKRRKDIDAHFLIWCKLVLKGHPALAECPYTRAYLLNKIVGNSLS